MRKKYLIAIILFVVFSLSALAFSFWYITRQSEKNMRGQYFFANTRKNIQNIGLIKMITPENGDINIYYEKGVWRFMEAADYFINTDMLAIFYKMVNDSIIVTVNDVDFGSKKLMTAKDASESEQGTQVVVYDMDGNVLDDVVIGDVTQSGKERLARYTNGHYAYGISSANPFSGEASAWIPMPLLEVKNYMLESLKIGDKKLNREQLNVLISSSKVVKDVVNAVSFVFYDGIVSRHDFETDFPDSKAKRIVLETDVGEVYVLDVYKIDETYWLSVKLTTTKIFVRGVKELVDSNQVYYADWVFQLNEEQGAVLYEAQL